jgi:hypothetical protein
MMRIFIPVIPDDIAYSSVPEDDHHGPPWGARLNEHLRE